MSSIQETQVTLEHGWRAVPRSMSATLKTRESDLKASPKAYGVEGIRLPDSDTARKVMAYAKSELLLQTFNHSMRVYYYGKAIMLEHFPSWNVSDETYLITCLLHDIGTTDKNLNATLMSFEFYGALVAGRFLEQDLSAPKAQSEAVMEAIIRHQDLGETGEITELGQIIQLATVFDNVGMNPELVAQETIQNVTKAWPRKGWTGCFVQTINEEQRLKPWCHTTSIEGFAEKVQGNELMRPYDA